MTVSPVGNINPDKFSAYEGGLPTGYAGYRGANNVWYGFNPQTPQPMTTFTPTGAGHGNPNAAGFPQFTQTFPGGNFPSGPPAGTFPGQIPGSITPNSQPGAGFPGSGVPAVGGQPAPQFQPTDITGGAGGGIAPPGSFHPGPGQFPGGGFGVGVGGPMSNPAGGPNPTFQNFLNNNNNQASNNQNQNNRNAGGMPSVYGNSWTNVVR